MTAPAAYLSRASLAAALDMAESTVDEMVRRGVLPAADGDNLWDWKKVDARLRNLSPQGAVYVIGFGLYVKIGFTLGEVARRVAALQTSAPDKLTIFASFHGDVKRERELHKRFAAYRSYGEWFKREGELAAWIDAGCPA